MTDPIDQKSALDPSEESSKDDRVVNPNELVYSAGTPSNPQEVLQNPAVAPQTLNQPDDLRDDLMRDPPEEVE